MRQTVIFLCAVALVGALGCGEDQDEGASGTTLALAFTGADPLANGYHYEG